VVDRLTVINTPTARAPRPLQHRLALAPVVGSGYLKQFLHRAAFHGLFHDAVYATPEGYDRATVDAWYDAFAVKEGDAMYVKPSDRARIW
jgi:hypothetical protein